MNKLLPFLYAMRIYAPIILLVLALAGAAGAVFAQEEGHTIRGKLQVDSSWNAEVYLSYLPTFDDLHRITNQMIVDRVKMSPDGSFAFSTRFLPEEDGLYRIHLTKKGDPAASIIIGGRDQNFLFLIANRNTDLFVYNEEGVGLFDKVTIEGYLPNHKLQEISQIASYIDSADVSTSNIKRTFIAQAIYEKLRAVADSSKHPLTSLFALYHSNFLSNYVNNKGYYEEYLQRWQAENSSYFQAFREQIPQRQAEKSSSMVWLYAILFFGLGWGGRTAWSMLRNRKTKKVQQLSVQERKVFRMMQEGKSNKEISEACNIGMNTVKSHVSSIYAKLNIKSRKEAMDLPKN